MRPAPLLAMTLILGAGCGSNDDDPGGPNPPPDNPVATPTSVMVLPGPVAGMLTVSWLPTVQTNTDFVYRGTAPGVTPQTGTRLGPTGNLYHDRDLLPGTYYYVVTRSDGTHESGPSEEVRVVWDEGIVMETLSPGQGTPQDDTVFVAIKITSDVSITEAIARVADREVALVHKPDTSDLPDSWQGTLSFAGLPHTGQRITVEATDGAGHHVEGSIPVRFDTPPLLTVEQPVYGDVARPTVHFKARCEDDDPRGCASIAMYATDDRGNFAETMFSTSASSVETDVSFEGITLGKVLQIIATDRTGQRAIVYRDVIHETPTAAVQPLIRVPGRIMDVSDESILYAITEPQFPELPFPSSLPPTTVAIVRRDRQTGAEDTVATGPSYRSGLLGPFGLLGPPGVVLLYRESLIELRNGVETDLGPATNVQVAGAYATWVIPTTGPYLHDIPLVRRDLGAGVTSSVLDPLASDVGGAVAADGDVTWSNANGELWWYQNGTGAVKISPDGTHNSVPVTDGQQVLYRRDDDIVHYDAGGETVVSSGLPRSPGTGVGEYATTAGWSVFPRLDNAGYQQLWTRSPAGVEQQVTHVVADLLLLVSLGPGGEVVYVTITGGAANQFFTRPPYTSSVPVGTVGQFRFEGSKVYKVIGTTLFSVTP